MLKHTRLILLLVGFFLIAENIFAQAYFITGGGFESKMDNLTNKMVTVLLPIMSLVGLIYACILALMGDGAAKQRITMVLACSAIGLLAPVIVSWIKSIVGY